MSLKSYEDLNEMQLDALKEIGNIGSGNAASSLSTMLDKPVDIGIPQIAILEYEEVVERLGGAEQLQVGLLFSMEDEISGMIMFLLQKEFASMVVSELTGCEISDNEDMGEMEQSAMQEVGNIMAASYVTAMSELTGLNINISVPSFSFDMTGSLLSVPAIYYANISDKMIFIEGKIDKKTNNDSTSHILMIPEVESLEKIMQSLGLDE